MTATAGTDSLVIRPIAAEEWEQAGQLMDLVFSDTDRTPEQRADSRSVFEIERSLAAWDDDLIAGFTAAYSFRMSVPGGDQIPVAGVTWVGVRPTHRRRGILRTLMRRQLEDLHSSGEAIAALYASEALIYGRFGYGLASYAADVVVPRGAVALAGAPSDPALRLRMISPADSLALIDPVYQAMLTPRPGMIARDKTWAQRRIFDPELWRKGSTELMCVLAEDRTGVRGYAWYATVGSWDENALPVGTVRVREVGATDPAAYAEVWRYLLDLDLMSTVETRLPVDDPLLHMVTDMRRTRPSVKDQLFVRVVDVGRGLAARRYAAEVDVVLEVTDPFCPWNPGRWRLTGGPAGASCAPTDAPADLRLTALELGAAYLGGVSLRALALAGRVTELRPGALGAASRAFSSDVQPFCMVPF